MIKEKKRNEKERKKNGAYALLFILVMWLTFHCESNIFIFDKRIVYTGFFNALLYFKKFKCK